MFKHTPDQAREAWVQALRSGQYEQWRGRLRSLKDDRFCCLGVACDMFLKMEDRGEWRRIGCFAATPDDRATAALPDLVRCWLGLSSCLGELTGSIHYGDDDPAENLIDLNDYARYSFAAITDVIEAGKVRLA